MKKNCIRIISILLVLLITLPVTYAGVDTPGERDYHYVALGDSIAAYFGVQKGQGYAEILADFLADEPGYEGLYLTNLARSGDDSTDILSMIDAYSETIRGADLITISIGANNFLGLLLNRIYGFFEERYGSDFGLSFPEVDDEILGELAEAFGGLSFLAEVAAGVERLRTDISTLISELRLLSPSAEIYFMLVYNPLSESDSIYGMVDILVKSVNTIIEDNSDLGYTTVAVYDAFRETGAQGLTFADISAGSFDPHPTVTGHKLIARTHFYAITGKTLEIPDDYSNALLLTRAEALSSLFDGIFSINPMIMNSIFRNGNDVPEFSDVPEHHPRGMYVAAARRFMIVNGVGGNLFQPDEYMTRQDYAVTLSRLCAVLQDMGYELDLQHGAAEAYPDIDSVASYAFEAVEFFFATPLLTPIDGMICPLEPITSADAPAFRTLLRP